jgi:hypothetical protein
MSADTRLSTTSCPACGGRGPSARLDGYRFDSAPDATCPDCGAGRGALASPPPTTQPPATPNAAKAARDPLETLFRGRQLFRILYDVLEERGEDPLTWLRVMVDQLPPDVSVEVRNRREQEDEEMRLREAEEAEKKAQQRAEEEAREADPEWRAWRAWKKLPKEEQRAAWVAYQDRHRAEVERRCALPAPVELPAGAVRWVTVGRSGLLGVGVTIEQAHRDGLLEAHSFMLSLDPGLSSGDPPPNWGGVDQDPDRIIVDEIVGYVRVSGPLELVEELIGGAWG